MKKILKSQLTKIKLFATDVDGVLTDGGMYYSENGTELKKFNTRDGMGMVLLRNAGISIAIITSEDTEVVRRRAEKLQVKDLIQGAKDKVAAMEKLLARRSLAWNEIAYIGDDVNDTELLKRVGFAATPADGIERNKAIAHYVTKKKGGEGCVREVCDLLLQLHSPH
ncbi:MAG: HAD-IIIA family hydrolase [Bacteroidota bacterium]|nr:HAD-IIIA family hydrolase [Bacteroidota bacterium]